MYCILLFFTILEVYNFYLYLCRCILYFIIYHVHPSLTMLILMSMPKIVNGNLTIYFLNLQNLDLILAFIMAHGYIFLMFSHFFISASHE